MSRPVDHRQGIAVSECSGGPFSSGHGVLFHVAATSAIGCEHQPSSSPGHGRGRRCTCAAPHRTPRPGQPPTRSRAPRARAVGASARRCCSGGRRQRVPGGRVIVEGARGCGHPAVAARRWHQGALDAACRGKRRGGAAGLRRASLSLRGGSGHPPFGEEHGRDAAPGSPRPAARRRLPLGPRCRPTRSGQPRSRREQRAEKRAQP